MPRVDPQCTTHHFACACREARFKRMEELLRRVADAGLDDQQSKKLNRQADKLMDEIQEVLREE